MVFAKGSTHPAGYEPMEVNGFSGNTDLKPGVIFHSKYGPSICRDSSSRNYVRANDHNDHANELCGLVRRRRLLRQ